MPRIAQKLAYAALLFAGQAWAGSFDSPLRSVAWHTMSDAARIAAVIGCVFIPAIVLGMLAAGERKERRLALALFSALALLWGSYARLAGTVWYFRPASDCAFNGDGTAYDCAPSGGAAGAWRTSAAVSWAPTTGVDDGSVLKGCGDFVEADLDVNQYFIFLAGTVTAANEAGRIRIKGDCSDEGGRSYATVTGGSTMTVGFGMSTSDFITLEDFRFYNLTQMIGNTCSPASDPDAPIFRNLTGRNITNTGAAMSINGIGYLAENIDIETVGEPMFVCNGTTNVSAGEVRNARLVSTSTTDANADGIQQEAGGGGIKLTNIDVYKANPFKGCGIVGSATGAVQVDGFRCHWQGAPGAAVSGLAVDGSATGGYVRGLWSNAPGSALILRDDVTSFAGTFDVSSVVGAGVAEILALDGAHASGVFTFSHISGWATEEGIVAESGFNPSSATFRNLAIDAPVGIDVNATVAAADIDIDYVRWGPNVASWKWRGTTDTSLADYQTTSSKGAADTQGSFDWVGGTNPTTAEGFRLSAGSPLAGAGTDLGDEIADFFGDLMYDGKWDIGAFRRDSCYRRSRDGKLDPARTRSQVVSRCLGVPGRYPEGL